MSYNLLLDTEFKNNNWDYINCELKDNCITSTDKVFGVKQKLILPNLTKLYFRVDYITDNISIKNIKIGIQNKDDLHIDEKTPKLRKPQHISVIDYNTQKEITLHIIFESETKINKVIISNPILIDLNYIGKSTWLKWVLDNTIKYREGYHYKNIYKDYELKPSVEDLKEYNLEEGKIGSLLQLNKPLNLKINAKFINGKYYLIKLNYEEINKFGDINIKYGDLESSNIDNNQLYLIFKANDKDNLYIEIIPNDIIDYQINLKYLLAIDITNMKLMQEDIAYLPYLGDE